MKSIKELDFCLVEIIGERVLLRPISDDYCDDIFREFTREITQFMFPASPTDISQVKSFIEISEVGMKNKTDLVLVITDINNNEFLGVCGLHGRKTPDEPELGVWLKKSAHSQQFGREAIVHLDNWAKNNIVFNFLIYPVDKDNTPSRKIAEFLGGQVFREDTRTSMSGIVLNEVVYKIIR